MFVSWHLRRIILAGQMFASDNIESRDWKKNTPILQKPFKSLPASARPKIQTEKLSMKNQPGIIDFTCKTTSTNANTNMKTITTRFLRRLKQTMKEIDAMKQTKKDVNKVTGKFLRNSGQMVQREPFLK
jgi:hypothetical protein